MRFQDSENLSEFGIGLGHGLFHGRELGPCPFTRLFGEILWRTDTRYYVLTLRIDQDFAIIAILSGRGIAGEGTARGGRITHVSEYSRLHIDARAPLPGNTVQPAIEIGRAHV